MAPPTNSATNEWPSTLPLHSESEASSQTRPYPVDALPSIVQTAVTDYQKYGQQPLPLIACSALANVSLACQSMADVARDHLLKSPVSVFFMILAESGERKSAADHAFGQATRQWEKTVREQLEPNIKIARTFHQAWSAEKDALISQIRRAAIDNNNTEQLKGQYLSLSEEEPIIPVLPMLFFEDATQEAITAHLSSGWPSASLWSDEGSIIFSSHGMQTNATKFIATLNRLWDGKPFITHRKTTKSFTVSHRRLTVSLMLQPMVFHKLLHKNSGMSRQSGFLARSLITYPESSMGERYYQEPPTSLNAMESFSQRIIDCLNSSLELNSSGCDNIPTLTFSAPAKKLWISFFNAIEKGLANPTQWLTMKDFASKAAENMARLSALFHLFEGKSGPIEAETVEQASQIIEWHLWETKRLLQGEYHLSWQQDARKLIQWLAEKNLKQTTPREIQQLSPIRDKHRRDIAIQNLIKTHHVKETTENGKSLLLVNPALLDDTPLAI